MDMNWKIQVEITTNLLLYKWEFEKNKCTLFQMRLKFGIIIFN